MSAPKALIFDLDGTLVDSLGFSLGIFNQVFVQFGARSHTPQEIMKYFGPGEEAIFEKVLGASQAASAYREFLRLSTENLERMPLHSGISELLTILAQKKMPISIVTGRGRDTTETILKHHGIRDRFVSVICHEDVPAPKPSPAGIQIALSALGLPSRDVAYVGDMHVDVMAAKGASVVSIAALWDPLVNHDLIQAHAPDYQVSTPDMILNLL